MMMMMMMMMMISQKILECYSENFRLKLKHLLHNNCLQALTWASPYKTGTTLSRPQPR